MWKAKKKGTYYTLLQSFLSLLSFFGTKIEKTPPFHIPDSALHCSLIAQTEWSFTFQTTRWFWQRVLMVWFPWSISKRSSHGQIEDRYHSDFVLTDASFWYSVCSCYELSSGFHQRVVSQKLHCVWELYILQGDTISVLCILDTFFFPS